MSNMKHALPYERVKIADLVHDPENARTHDERNILAIMESLKMHQQRKPIVLNGNIIIAGNGTVEAARRLGWEYIDANTAGFDEDGYAEAYAVQDNRTGELAGWNNGKLHETLSNLAALDFEIPDLGFTDEEMKKLLSPEFTPNLKDESDEEKTSKISLTVIFESEEDQQELFTELRDRGFKVKA